MKLRGTILAVLMLASVGCKTDSNIQKVPAPTNAAPVDNDSDSDSDVASAPQSPLPATGTAAASSTSTACATGPDCSGQTSPADPSWCTQEGATLFMDPSFDFDGDGKDDWLCSETSGKKTIQFGNGTTWEATSPWCTHQGATVTVSDENADGRSDLVCTDGTQKRSIAEASPDGSFVFDESARAADEAGAADTWCTHETAKKFPGDFDGDGLPDQFCADAKGGKWWRYGRGATQEAAALWCTHKGSWVEVFDSDGDGRTDLICRDSESHRWVSLARADGSFAFDQ